MTKKAKKTENKVKEFASKPFTSLKGLKAEPQERRDAPKAPPAPEVSLSGEDDAALFLRAMGDAKRLHPKPAATGAGKTGKEAAAAHEGGGEERSVFLEAIGKLKLDVTFKDDFPGDDDNARNLPVNRLRQLKKGTIRIDLELDLHGLTKDEALENLGRFITGAYLRGQKAVLVITGKGNNSPGEPVLQGAVSSWLREKGRGMVAEFAPAPRDMGGSGALVVFLKDRGKKEE